MKANERSVDLKMIERKLQDVIVFSNCGFDPNNYIDELLSEQCDISLEVGIDNFSLDPLIEILSLGQNKLEQQFKIHVAAVNSLQEQCVFEEEKHVSIIQQTKQRMEKAQDEFKRTEDGLNQITEEVMQFGERLMDLKEEITKDKEALEIIRIFRRMNNDEDFNVKNYDIEYPDVDFILKIKKLKQLCRELTNENVIWGIQHVGDYYNHLNKKLNAAFVKAFDDGNFMEMKDNAELLYYLNGGNESVDYYISNNQFLLDELEVAADEKLASENEEISNQELCIQNQRVEAFFKKMINKIQVEKRNIDKIFVQKGTVTEEFMRQVFEFRIQNFLDIYLHESSKTTMEYLFKLYDVVDKTITLLGKSLANSDIINMKFINEMVENCFKEDMDEFYQVNEKEYIQELFKNFKTLYDKNKKEIKIDSSSKVNVEGIGKLIDTNGVKELMKQFSFSISRAKILCPSNELVSFLASLFEIVMNWIDGVLKDSMEKMVYLTQKYSTEPTKSVGFLRGFLGLLKSDCESINLIKNTIEKEILPNFKYSFHTYNECSNGFKTKRTEIESIINKSLENLNDWIVKVIEKELKYKNEFKFKDESDTTWAHSPACTMICKEFCEYLNEYIKSIDEYISGLNHKNFMIRFGRKLFERFVETLKDLKITPFSGGFILMYDIRCISDIIRNSSFPSIIKSMFDNLTMLFKIYCIDKDNVIPITNTIIADGGFEFIDPNEMLKCRTDYNKKMVVDYAQGNGH